MTIKLTPMNISSSVLTRKLTSIRFLNTRVLTIFCQLVLVVLLARQLAITTWQLIPATPESAPAFKVASVYTTARRSNSEADPFASLSSLHLFGQPPKIQQGRMSAPTLAPEAVPVSRLAVRITGLVASSQPENSLVIIRSGSTDSTYQPGDRLKGTQATVDTIYADRVIVRNGERYESLLMYPDEVRGKPAVSVASTRTPRQKARENLQQQLQENPNSWTEIISISPIRENGELRGYRINPAQYPELFARLGLKPNDIAIAINGYDLTNTGEALNVMSQLSNPENKLDQISLTIERDGQRFEVDLSA